MKKNSLFLIVALLTTLFSCNSDEKVNSNGFIRIDVVTNTSVITKAEENVEIKNIRLVISNITENSSDKDWSKEYNFAPNESIGDIELAPGKYKLVAIASNGNETLNGFNPVYRGETTAEVIAGETRSAQLECKLTTVKVSVEYDQNLKDTYQTEYKTVVGGVTFSSDEEGRAGYITPGDLSVDFMFKNNAGSWQTISLKKIAEAKACEYYKIKISMKSTEGGEGESSEGAANVTIQFGEENPQDINIGIVLPEIIVQTRTAEFEFFTATLRGFYSTPSGKDAPIDKLFFYYRKRTEPASQWISTPAIRVNNDEYNYQASLQNLEAGTDYEYMFMEKGNVMTFTTKEDLVETLPANAWSRFVYLYGTWASNPDVSEVYFEWREKNSSTWQKITENITVNNGVYQAVLKNLVPEKDYEYRFANSIVQDFTTAQIAQLPYSDFETWSIYTGKYIGKKFETYYLGTQSEANNHDAFWDSGNYGTSSGLAAFAYKNPTQSADGKRTDGLGNKVAYLKSQFVGIGSAGQFAAGNLYIGKYGETIGTSGAKINFGRKWTVRPTSLHGWYKYKAGTIDYQGKNGPQVKDSPDQCAIYIALVKTTNPVSEELYHLLNNTDISTFIDFSENNKDIIAYGEISESQSKVSINNDWEEFDVPLIYRDKEAIPTHILVVTSASKYGDYFTGSTSSEMWLDDFELKYDYIPSLDPIN